MTHLPEQMIRPWNLKNLFTNTQRAYLAAVTGISRHYQKSPVKITDKMIEDYLLYLKFDHPADFAMRVVEVTEDADLGRAGHHAGRFLIAL